MIQVFGDVIPTVPSEFLERLRRFDPTLLVMWNPRKHQWMIEQCIQHLAPAAAHTHICRRVYVVMVGAPNGAPMPLGDHVFQKLAQIDTWRQGFGPGRERAFKLDRDGKTAELKAKEERAMREVVRLNSLDHRRQLLHAEHLIQQHDLRPNR